MLPRIMVCLPTKNDRKYVNEFLNQWKNIDYPKNRLRFVIVYGDKVKPEVFSDFFEENNFDYEMHREVPFENKTKNSLWIADVCNYFKEFYVEEDYILIGDTDLSYLPPNLIKELVNVDKDIVAPYIWQEFNHNVFFDTYIFRYGGNKRYDANNPPFKTSKEPVQIESVGTIFLIRTKVFLNVKWENPAPHYQFCRNARSLGYTIWTLPYVGVRHADVRNESHPEAKDYIYKFSREELDRMEGL